MTPLDGHQRDRWCLGQAAATGSMSKSGKPAAMLRLKGAFIHGVGGPLSRGKERRTRTIPC